MRVLQIEKLEVFVNKRVYAFLGWGEERNHTFCDKKSHSLMRK